MELAGNRSIQPSSNSDSHLLIEGIVFGPLPFQPGYLLCLEQHLKNSSKKACLKQDSCMLEALFKSLMSYLAIRLACITQ
jgi:hypothetical protein